MAPGHLRVSTRCGIPLVVGSVSEQASAGVP